MTNKTLQTVVETPEFIKQARHYMSDAAREDFINFIASHPVSGDVIVGTGGARKIRWHSNEHRGKRGGARVIYYFHNQNMPIFLFTVYCKTQRANLTMKEQNELKKVIGFIVNEYEAKEYEQS